MLKRIICKFFIFLIFGFIWLFIFSIPIGKNGKRLFQISYYYIVDTRPVHWVVNKLSKEAKSTEDQVKEKTVEAIDKIHSEIKK